MGRSWLPLVVVLATAIPALAAAPEEGLGPRAWKLEAVELCDGRRLEGLILAGRRGTPGPDDDDIELVQVIRPEGRKTHLIGWPPFPADTVRFVERLPELEHLDLAAKIDAFRAGERRRSSAAAVRLARSDEDGPWRYEGPDFTLDSTADPTLTREAVVRLELVLAALPSLVDPVADGEPLTVSLCGSLAEYRRIQDGLGLRIDNPAFYLPGRRLLVAGSELSALLAERRVADDLLDSAVQQQATRDQMFETLIRELATEQDGQQKPAAERAALVQKARQRHTRERTQLMAQIEVARRDNAAVIARARRVFEGWLAHEAWHAYADRRLRVADAPGLPAWLDEGLAQVVETAPVEAGEVRLDLFDRERLVRLQDQLRVGGVPPVADIVTGGQEPFVAGHTGRDQAVAYLTAWGLALDLAIIRPVLSAARVRELTAAGEADAVARFEGLVGMPIDRFDRQWRERMLAIRSLPAGAVIKAAPPVHEPPQLPARSAGGRRPAGRRRPACGRRHP